jgi:UDP-2,3-diacylglucosamine pyrophosphatase LpxH
MQTGRLSCRTAFISDVHLGTRGCQAELLLDFIKALECETLYLIGDIVDGWKLKGGWFWPQAHNDVVQKILRLARRGVRVVYIPGNHDDGVRDYCGVHFGGVEVQLDAIHKAADGRRYLVIHGDQFDGVVTHAKWLAFAGDWGYRALLAMNTKVNRLRAALGLKPWSLSAYVKTRVKKALQFIENFEAALAAEAKRRGVDGVVCGHIHKAEMCDIAGVRYINDGDWVESCTAAVERHDGCFEIIDWRAWRLLHPAGEPVAETPEREAEPALVLA